MEGEGFWEQLVAGEDGSSLWSRLLLPDSERIYRLAFSPLAAEPLALGVETVYEGYLVHYGRSRLYGAGDSKLALLLGDHLYALGLVRVSRLGDSAAIAGLAELLELCARLQAEQGEGDGALWAAGIARLGRGGIREQGEAFLASGDESELLRLARESAGDEAAAEALATHSWLVMPPAAP